MQLSIQGIDVNVRDLDLVTDKEGINIFRKELMEYVKKDFYNEKIKARSILCQIKNVEVEILYYNDKSLAMFDKIRIINWKGLKVPILPIKNARQFYKLINRKEKIEIIDDFLKNMSQKLYRFTTNGEGIFSIGKRLLPSSLVQEVLEAKKWLPKPKLPQCNYVFYLTEKGKDLYEKTLLLSHKKYLKNIKREEINRSQLINIIYEDEYQVVEILH